MEVSHFQLPMVEGMDPGTRLEGEAALLVESASRCYVEQCPRAQIKEFVEVNLGMYHNLCLLSRYLRKNMSESVIFVAFTNK